MRVRGVISALLMGTAISLGGGPGLAQETEASGEDEEARQEVVVVTGSRRNGRTVADSPVPIDVLSGEDLTIGQGRQDLNLILRNLVPSFNFPEPALNDATDAVRPATLRGLSPDQTLVLVNSNRRHRSAQVNVLGSLGRGSNPVDLSTIPSNALDRVEVLRDGAAAQYGSDAIAGIINLRLKEQRDGFDMSVQYGQHFEGDGEQVVIQATKGLALTENGFATISLEYIDQGDTDRAGPEPRAEAMRTLTEQGFFVGTPLETSVDNVPDPGLGQPERQSLAVTLNSGLDLGNGHDLSVFATFNDRRVDAGNFFYREPFATGDLLDLNVDPANIGTDQVPGIFPVGYQPVLRTDSQDLSMAGELSGAIIDDLDYTASVTYGANKLDFELRNSINASLGTASPTEFDTGGLENRELTVNLDLVRPVEIGFASPLNIAFGAEYRHEEYEVIAGEPASFAQGDSTTPDGRPRAPFSNGFPGFRPADEVDANRDSFSAYVDLEADVTERLLVGVAGRFESFSDFGDDVNGKISARYEVSDALALRASASTGFRAPTLAQSFFTRIQAVLDDDTNQVEETGVFPVSSSAAQAFGAQPLDAEEAVNLTGGFVATPFPGASLEVDVYHIQIDDRIILTETLDPNAAERATLDSLGLASVQEVQFFVNGVDSTNTGVDLTASYDRDLGARARGRLSVGFNYNDAEVDEILTPERDDPTEELVSRREVGFIEDTQPDTRLNIAASYFYQDRYSATLRANRFAEVIVRDDLDGSIDDETFDSAWTLDLELGMQVNDRFKIAAGGNNITDEAVEDDDFFGWIAFDGRSPIGFNGGFWYLRGEVSF
jgi:iron complex outermembrane receptor protein